MCPAAWMQSHDNLRCSPYGDSFGPIQDSVHWVQHMYRALQPHFKVYPTKSAVASTQEQMQREPKQYSFHKCLQNLRKPFWKQVAVCVCVCVCTCVCFVFLKHVIQWSSDTPERTATSCKYAASVDPPGMGTLAQFQFQLTLLSFF